MRNSTLAPQVVAAIRSVVGDGSAALHEPTFAGNEWAYVKECIDTGWVSSVGKFVDRFEKDLAEYTGARYAVAVANGTVGLQVALMVAGVQPDDEVLVPALSFVATANSVIHARAVPHFVDVDGNTLGMAVDALEAHLRATAVRRGSESFNARTGRRISALVPMHTFGHPVDVEGLHALAERWGLLLVEDAAESLGTRLNGQHTGTFGACGVLSFNGNKIVTTGGGGAIITNDPVLAKRAKHLTTTAKLPHRWEFRHDEVAFNFRLPNLNAALGCAQLEQLEGFIERKRQLTLAYLRAFEGVRGVALYTERAGVRSNYWLQTLLLDEGESTHRDAVLAATNDAGLMTRPVWDLLPSLPMFKSAPCAQCSVSTSLARRVVNIPSSPTLGHGA